MTSFIEVLAAVGTVVALVADALAVYEFYSRWRQKHKRE